MALDVTISARKDASGRTVMVVSLGGILDSQTASAAQVALAKVTIEKPRTVVFDLAELKFIDSRGIGVILSSRMEIKKAGGSVAMANLRQPIERAFDVVRGLPGVPIFRSMAELDRFLAEVQDDVRAEENSGDEGPDGSNDPDDGDQGGAA